MGGEPIVLEQSGDRMMRKHNDQQTDDSIDLFNTISFLRPVYIVNQLTRLESVHE